MAEDYCGVKFRTIFNNRIIPKNKKVEGLLNWCREFNRCGFTPKAGSGSAGNLSFRTNNGFIISCSQADFSNADPEYFTEVLSVDISKREILVNGRKEPSSESFMHNELYQRRNDINAVFHGHSEDFLKYGEKLSLPITEKEQPGGSIELMREVIKILNDNSFILIKNHGFLSMGDSMASAGNLAIKRYSQLQRIKKLIN